MQRMLAESCQNLSSEFPTEAGTNWALQFTKENGLA